MNELPMGANARYMAALQSQYELLRHDQLALDMTRGKPCAEQLDLSNPMLADGEYMFEGEDCRNYGSLLGLTAARKMCAKYLGTDWKHTLVYGSSSLHLMEMVLVEHVLKRRWTQGAKFICPVPGYDRHFAICTALGIEMIPVAMTPHGPDMVAVRELVKDRDVVGMWCMPLYSNPTGISYSRAITRELVEMFTANPNFTIMWDNAYAHHHLSPARHSAVDIMEYARARKTDHRVWIFGSFSKVTFASAGLSMLSTSPRNFEWFQKALAVRTIGPDKLTQARHVRFLKNLTGIKKLMGRHERIIRPKFEAVCQELQKTIGGKGIADWSMPEGGYFISLYMRDGSARRVVELAKQVGLALTPAGAAFPNGNDRDDTHIRIAPTFPSLEEVRRAAHVLGICAELAHREVHPQTARR